VSIRTADSREPVLAHITLNSDEPGIRGLFRFRPETAGPLNELVEVRPVPVQAGDGGAAE